MKNQKKFFFNKENLKELKLNEKQMANVFGGSTDSILDSGDGTHTKTINYDRYTVYTESTYVRKFN